MRMYYSKTNAEIFANDIIFFEFEKQQILDRYSNDLRFANSLYNSRKWKWKSNYTNECFDENHVRENFAQLITFAIIAKNLVTKIKSRHLFYNTTFIWDFRKNWKIFASKFNAKHRNVRIHDSLIRNSVLSRSNFTYLYMRFERSFRSRYNFVADFLKRIQNFAKNDFVFVKQNSNRFLEHYSVAKIQYIFLSKEQQVFSRFEFSFARYVFANHLANHFANHLALRAYLLASFANYFVSFADHFVLLANHFVFFANYEFHAANLLEKFVTSQAKISHQSRKFVELFAVVVILFLNVVISFIIFSTRCAIVKIVM